MRKILESLIRPTEMILVPISSILPGQSSERCDRCFPSPHAPQQWLRKMLESLESLMRKILESLILELNLSRAAAICMVTSLEQKGHKTHTHISPRVMYLFKRTLLLLVCVLKLAVMQVSATYCFLLPPPRRLRARILEPSGR